MTDIPGVVTEDTLKYWPQMFGSLQTFYPLSHFKVGEGGWIDPGTGPVPRTPDGTLRDTVTLLQDLDALVDLSRPAPQQRYTPDSRASFTKSLAPGDFTFVAPDILRVKLFLDFGEFNDDGFGNSPELWEAAVFSTHPTVGGQKLMVGYATFPKIEKNAGRQLETAMRLRFKVG